MPFITKDTTLDISNPVNEIPDDPDQLGFIDVIGDAFHIDNPVVGLFKDRDRTIDSHSTFDTLQRLKDDGVDINLWNSFIYVDDEEEYQKTRASVNHDVEARQRISEAGISGMMASMVAASASPSLFIGGGALVASLKAGKKAYKAGLITGSVTAATVYGEERILQATQAGRTDEEVALNTAVGFVLGALVGGGGVKFKNSKLQKIAHETKQKMAVEQNIDKAPESLSDFAEFDKSVGAAQSDQQAIFDSLGLEALNKEQLGLAKSENKFVQPILDGYVKLNKLWNPAVRMISASSKRVRQLYLELAETSLKPQLVKEGFALNESLEGVLKRRYSDYSENVMKFGQSWKEYKKSNGNLNWKEFRNEVGKASRRAEEHPDPNIANAASGMNKYYEGIAEEMSEIKMLPEGITTPKEGARYLNRSWRMQAIQNDIPKFKTNIEPYLRKQHTKIKNRLEGLVEEVDKKTGKPTPEALDAREQIRKFYNEEDFNQTVKESVNGVTNNLLKNKDILGFQPTVIGGKSPLKKRAFNIPDAEIEDWLDNDILYLSDKYTRQVVPEIEIRKRFGEDGLKKVEEEIHAEYNTLQENASPKEAKKLDKERKRVLKDIDTTFNLLRGTYKGFGGDPDSFLRSASQSLLTYNYIVGLGGVVISSISDAGMGILRRGFTNFFGKSLKPFIEDVAKTGGKMSRAEARSYGQAFETVNSSRTQSLLSIGDPMAFGSPFERFLGNIGNNFSNINLINYWNDMFQQVNTLGVRFRMVNNIDDFINKGKLGKREEEFMNFVGIGKSSRIAMKKQIDEFGEEINGNIIPNIDKWTDKKLKEKFKAAIGKEVDRTIITKGATDIPRFGNTLLGKIVFQWQNFNFAFNNKVLISGLQDADGRVAAGLGTLMSLGMLTEFLKAKGSGQPLPQNPQQWVDAGLDRSGILGMLSYGNSVPAIAGFDYRGLLKDDPTIKSDRRAKNATEVFLGPTGQTLTKATHFAASLSKDGITKGDVHRARTLMPYQNIFYLKPIFDVFEKRIAKGLPETR